jgi:hypothetical protein
LQRAATPDTHRSTALDAVLDRDGVRWVIKHCPPAHEENVEVVAARRRAAWTTRGLDSSNKRETPVDGRGTAGFREYGGRFTRRPCPGSTLQLHHGRCRVALLDAYKCRAMSSEV